MNRHRSDVGPFQSNIIQWHSACTYNFVVLISRERDWLAPAVLDTGRDDMVRSALAFSGVPPRARRRLPTWEPASDVMGVYTCALALLLDVDEDIQIPEI